MQRLATLLLCFTLAGGCASDRPPEETTSDGLVRVPSRSVGGVYRAPDATFTQYRRIILEAPSITFASGWRDNHKDVTDSEIARIRTEAALLFRDEFTRELMTRGPYEFADAPEPDVLLVSLSIEDLDIPAPEAAAEPGRRTYTPGPVRMTLTGELHDASTGRLVGRLIMIERQEKYGFNEMRLANRVTNSHEERIAFGKWSRLLREALDVAMVEGPRQNEVISAPR